MGLNHLSLGTEGTLLTLTERVAFSNLVDTKDTQTKQTTSKILQKALILIDLKRYHMEEKKEKAFKTQAGHNVPSLDWVGDAEEGCWPSTCEVSLIPSSQVGKRKTGRKEQVDKLGLSLAKVVLTTLLLVHSQDGLQCTRTRAAKFVQSVACVLHVAENSKEVSLSHF